MALIVIQYFSSRMMYCTDSDEVLELAGLGGAEEAGATLFGQFREDLRQSTRMNKAVGE